MNPIVSVVLPVYNCPHYVGEAIQSILAQSFADFELIIIDDGSTDETPAVLRHYHDSRIRFVRQENRGLASTLNRGIESAQGLYIARQDQDDISLSDRFEKQVTYLNARPDCALVGTWAEIWQDRLKTNRSHQHPSENSQLKFELLFDNPFVHSSTMLRKAALDRMGGYCTDPARQPPEDYELWSRIARHYEVGNIPETLHIYRETGGSMSRNGPSPFLDHLVTICSENIASAASMKPADPNVTNLAALIHEAEHRIIGEPDFNAMRNILRRAAMGVASGPLFQNKADGRINTLQYKYLVGHHKLDLAGRLLHLGRSIIARFQQQ